MNMNGRLGFFTFHEEIRRILWTLKGQKEELNFSDATEERWSSDLF